ncbi:WD repeat-containing 93-like isoform X5, partial [Brachionus plicatilis]
TADFIFLPANKLIWAANNDGSDNVTSIAVCWNHSSQIYLYPLGKVSKELESKFECVLPFSSQISQIEMTKCSNLLAVSLKDNNIVVFDLHMGIERTCVHLPDSEIIRQIFFMPKNAPSSSFLIENSTLLKVESELICLTSVGNLYGIDCTLNSGNKLRHLFSPQ